MAAPEENKPKRVPSAEEAGTSPGRGLSDAIKALAEWKELITSAAFFVGAVLSVFLASDTARLWALGIAVVTVPIGYYGYRIARRRAARREERARMLREWEKDKSRRTAFRGLFPFEEGEELPGSQRLREARAIATRVLSEDFRFGVVCGDSGCGKTSLLRTEVERVLQENGFTVVYVRSPRQIDTSEVPEEESFKGIKRELEALRRLLPAAEKVVLILDQFEDFFVEYRAATARNQLGRFLSELISASRPVRVLCAVRGEYLVGFRDLAPALAEPLTIRNLFEVKNFEVEEAKDVILRCAAGDGLAIDAEFAATVASDLQEDGFVRPPELQIVCTYLSGNVNVQRYRLSGGAAGILAHHVRDTIKLCGPPEAAAQVLRALCDFPSRARGKAKTLGELAQEATKLESLPQRDRPAAAEEILRQLEAARLVTGETPRRGDTAFSLVHDYLVESVRLATSDASTRTEEANQWLRYYLAEASGRIPLDRLWLIWRSADRTQLAQPNARRLLRRSLILLFVQGLGMLLAGTLVAALLYLGLTCRVVWKREVIGRHWEEGTTGDVRAIRVVGRKVLTDASADPLKGPRVWDGRTGRLLLDEEWFYVGRSGDWALAVSRDTRDPYFIDFPKGVRTPVLAPERVRVPRAFCDSDSAVAYVLDDGQGGEAKTIGVYSLGDGGLMGTVPVGHRLGGMHAGSHWLSASGDRLILSLLDSQERRFLGLYDVMTGKAVGDLGAEKEMAAFAVDEPRSRIASVEETPSSWIVQLRDLRSGALVARRDLRLREKHGVGPYRPGLRFSENGQDLVVVDAHGRWPPDPHYARFAAWGSGHDMVSRALGMEPEERFAVALNASDLLPIPWIPKEGTIGVACKNGCAVAWNESGVGLNVWRAGSDRPLLIPGLVVSSNDGIPWRVSKDELLQLTHHGSRLLSSGPSSPIELWDMSSGQLIRALSSPGVPRFIAFTDDDQGVFIKCEGGMFSLFDARTGELVAGSLAEEDFDCISYDPERRRILLWNRSGEVVRYTEGRYFFNYFRPTVRDERDKAQTGEEEIPHGAGTQQVNR